MGWIKVAAAEELPEGAILGLSASGRQYALFNVNGSFYACDGVCTHAQAFLADGYLEGDEVECPMHGGRFNVRTGKATCAPAQKDLRSYAVAVIAGDVFVDLPE